jgi:hypothetical protein
MIDLLANKDEYKDKLKELQDNNLIWLPQLRNCQSLFPELLVERP